VLSLDGIALDAPATMDMNALAKKLGGKLIPFACPNSSKAICTTRVRMMPATRVELYLPPNQPFPTGSATFLTTDYSTGADADDWPMVKLAHVIFTGNHGKPPAWMASVEVRGESASMLRADGILGAPANVSIQGVAKAVPFEVAKQIKSGKFEPATSGLDAATNREIKGLSSQQLQNLDKHLQTLASPNCPALAPGHRRRIFFGVPSDNPEGFGLGYEELDNHGNPVPGTFVDIEPFDHSVITVCLPLERGNRQKTEQWELINVSGEDHNFHIHQTKFKVLLADANSGDTGNMMDSVPVLHGTNACDGSVASWRSRACRVNPVEVSIPFTQIGDFVYHCHILEHEDGGMMAHIRVVANP
jgi:plastocyanin